MNAKLSILLWNTASLPWNEAWTTEKGNFLFLQNTETTKHPICCFEMQCTLFILFPGKKTKQSDCVPGQILLSLPHPCCSILGRNCYMFLCSVVQTSKCKSPNHNMNKERQLTILRTTRKEGGECLECWKSMRRPTFAPPSTRLSGGRDRCAGGVWPCLCLSAVSDLRQGRPWPALGYCVAAWGPGKA